MCKQQQQHCSTMCAVSCLQATTHHCTVCQNRAVRFKAAGQGQLCLTVSEAISWFSASLVAAAVPTAPMCIGSLPSLVSTGHALLSCGLVSEPTMMSKVPLEASGCDPKTGASRYCAPAASILEAMSQLSFGPTSRHAQTHHILCCYGVCDQVCSRVRASVSR